MFPQIHHCNFIIMHFTHNYHSTDQLLFISGSIFHCTLSLPGSGHPVLPGNNSSWSQGGNHLLLETRFLQTHQGKGTKLFTS